MLLYVFGNPDIPEDAVAFDVADELSHADPQLLVHPIGLNEDLPVDMLNQAVILDVVMGIDTETLITEQDIDKIISPPRDTAHDYDLGFQLKYLKKIHLLDRCWIIGLPYGKKVDSKRVIQLIQTVHQRLSD